jgi:hypothetical protein
MCCRNYAGNHYICIRNVKKEDMRDNNQQYAIKVVYDNLYSAFMRHDRKAIEYYCNNCEKLGIDHFHEKANKEAERMYSAVGVRTIPVLCSLEMMPDNVLMVYAQACMNVLFNERLQSFMYNCQYAYQTLAQPKQYKDSDVLYSQNKDVLTVGNFLKVLKYAISIAEIIKPEDKRFSNASASILALQSLYHLLNNSSETELTNHTLHVATDFFATTMKESLTDENAKRNTAVSALLVNLAIDFLVRE